MNYKSELYNIITALLSKDLIQNSGDFIAMQTPEGIYTSDASKKPISISMGDICKLSHKGCADIFLQNKSATLMLKTSAKFIGVVGISKSDLPPVLDDMVQILAPKIKNFPENNCKKITKELKKAGVVLLHSGSAIILAKNADDLLNKVLILDKATTAYVCGSVIGGVKPLPKFDAILLNLMYRYKYSKLAIARSKKSFSEQNYKPTAKMLELGQKLKDCGMQLLKDNLVQRTWGNASIRLDEKYFLATPSGIEYPKLTPDSCSLIEIKNANNWQGNLKPTTERKIHAKILENYPDMNAVIHSHPFYTCVFAAAKVDLKIENLEDITLLNSEQVKVSEYALPGTNKITHNAVKALNNNAKACILQNHGVVAMGKDIDEAYKILKILESIAMRTLEIKTEEQSGTPYNRSDLIKIFLRWVGLD